MQVHLTPNDSLRTAEIDGREMDEKDPWGPFLASAAYAIHSTFHTKLKATPGQLVFGRDMVMPIKFMTDWGAIEQQGQMYIPQVRPAHKIPQLPLGDDSPPWGR
jgi:hypothetical protein